MPLPFPVCCCSIALRDRPVTEAIDLIAAAGFDAIEFWFPHLEKLTRAELASVADQCARRGLAPLVIAPYFSFTRGNECTAESLQTAREALAAAKILRIKKIRTFIDAGPGTVSSASAKNCHWLAAQDGLRELCALDPDALFIMETHENTLADSLAGVNRLLNEVGRSNLRVNFQANHDFLERGYLPSLEALFPHISHLHWQQRTGDTGETYLEEPGRIDFAEVIRWLSERHYSGTASVEYCWRPVDENRIGTAAQFLSTIAQNLPSPNKSD
jgi:3-dehydroshikimate dehydratase